VSYVDADLDIECTDEHKGGCVGSVEYRIAPSGSAIPRCEKHNADRWDAYQADDLQRAASSDLAPDWFDPTLCGERWDDD
jgi:hypothetical protein